MSDLIKAQKTPQVNWYTCWTSLGANDMPDKLIEEGMKQPDCIKITFQIRTKDIKNTLRRTRHNLDPNFLIFMLQDSKAKILTWLFDPWRITVLQFNLMGQCFQEVGLTEWTNIISKQCPEKKDHTIYNFDECIMDYLMAVIGFPNVGDQIIRCLAPQ